MTDLVKMYAVFARETLVLMRNDDGTFCQGKLAAQAGHAYLHAWWDAETRLQLEEGDDYVGGATFEYSDYHYNVMLPYKIGNDARKIALVVDTVDDLKRLYDVYRPYMGATLVEDCGYTIFDKPTITAVGLGPINDAFLEGSELKALKSLRNIK